MSTKESVRFISILEAAKGVLVLLAGFGLLGLIHRDAQRMAEELVRQFHLNPASRFPRIFVEAATNSDDSTLWLLACAAFSYAALRLFEAFGLWRQRRWAVWLGVVSGALYIPIELYELLRGVSWPKVTLLSVNTVCVVCLAYALRSHGNVQESGFRIQGHPLLAKLISFLDLMCLPPKRGTRASSMKLRSHGRKICV